MNHPTTVAEFDAQIAMLLKQREDALKASKEADLDTVKRLCRQHGFTATQLKGYLKTRARNKKSDDDGDGTATTKTTRRGRKPKLVA
jgi:transposase-like protein